MLRDPHDFTLMRADLTADGLHPNAEGYKAMAEEIHWVIARAGEHASGQGRR